MARKKKAEQQPLFIQFVNCDLTNREEVFNLYDRAVNYFDQGFVESNDTIEYLDINIIKNYKPNNEYYFEKLKRCIELHRKMDIPGDIDIRQYFQNKTSKEYDEWFSIVKELRNSGVIDYEGPIYSCANINKDKLDISLEPFDMINFLYEMEHFQSTLKMSLDNVINAVMPIEIDAGLRNILYSHDKIRTAFHPGKDTYLRKKKFVGREGVEYGSQKVRKFFFKEEVKEIIGYDFAEFLCTPDWKRLTICPGVCGGKYFVKFYNRKYHSSKCTEATEYERDKTSGDSKARAKKHREKIRKEKERRRKEKLQQLREAAKRKEQRR